MLNLVKIKNITPVLPLATVFMLILFVALGATSVFAQTENGTSLTNPVPIEPKKPTAPFRVPHVAVLRKMIHIHMAALSNAIVTNNFSVLRALGTPKFQDANTAEVLVETFSPFRQNNLDISAVAIFKPILQEKPFVDASGKLRLKGYYNTNPRRVVFDLSFFPAFGKWKMDAISVHVDQQPRRTSKNRQQGIQRMIISSINVRDAPSIEGKLLDTLQPGQKIRVIARSANAPWHQVVVEPNIIGFIKTSVLERNSE